MAMTSISCMKLMMGLSWAPILPVGLAMAQAVPFLLPTAPSAWNAKNEVLAELPAQDGKPAGLQWNVAQSPWIALRQGMPMEVSAYNCMIVTIGNAKATTDRMVFDFGIESPLSRKAEHAKADVFLDFEGELEFRVHFRELTTCYGGGPLPEVLSLAISVSGRHRQPLVSTQAVLRGMRFVADAPREAEKGPRLTDAQLFEALDLERPELAGVRTAWAAGNAEVARRALGEYMRTRTSPRVYQIPANLPTRGEPPQLQRAGKDTGGRYSIGIPLDWAGWKRIELPLSSFQLQGKPVGWQWISELALQWSPQGGSPYDGRALYLDDIELLGPDNARTSLGDFEAPGSGWSDVVRTTKTVHNGTGAGCWQFPELFASVKCQCAPADWHSFDRISFWLHSPGGGSGTVTVTAGSYYPNTAAADRIIDRTTFQFWGYNVVLTPEGHIDWSANPMPHDEKWTIEWLAHFNRHEHFPTLYDAYWQTGDDKYAAELAREMNEWIEDCPEPVHRAGQYNYHYAWHPLNQGARLLNAWPQTLARCLSSPAFTDDIIANILKSMVEHQERLPNFLDSQNRRTCELSGIYVMGVLFPEFRRAPEWRRIALDGLTEQLTGEIYPDGLSSELALGYFCGMLRDFLKIVTLARDNGLEDEIPPPYIAQLEKSFNYIMGDSMPDGTAFGVNDSGNPDIRKTLIQGYQLFPQRDDFIYAISAGQGGRRPAADSMFFPYSGHAVMRSGWDASASVMHVDVGPYGASHQHEDKLNVGFFAYGKLLLVESGWVMYDTSRWRAYSLLTRSHNTVLVDGMDQYGPKSREISVWPKPWDAPAPPDSDARWLTAPGIDFCAGTYRGRYREYRDFMPTDKEPIYLDTVEHGRSVLYIKPDVWIVHDRLTAKDEGPHTAEVLYHIYADQAEAGAKGTVISVDEKGPRLSIAPLCPEALTVTIVKGKRDVPIQGWTASVRGNRKPGERMLDVPTTIYRTEWQKSTDIVTVLHPTPEGTDPGITTEPVTLEGDGLGGRFILPDGARHTYLVNHRPGTDLRAEDTHTDAEIVDICTEEGTGLRLGMVNGTRLAADSTSLLVSPAATAAVTGMAPNILTAGADRDAEITLSIPCLAKCPQLKVWLLDCEHKRERGADVQRSGTGLSWHVRAGRLYEINLDGTGSLADWEKEAKAQENREMDYPVKPQPVLPPVKGIRIVVQAEDYTGQGNGGVSLSTTKHGMDGTAFYCWDNPGHWLEYTVDIPEDGAYALTMRVCMKEPAERALLVDGAYPDEVFRCFLLDPTGGFSNGADDWGDRRLPKLLSLRKGKHILRFINVRNSANLDWFSLHAPGESPR